MTRESRRLALLSALLASVIVGCGTPRAAMTSDAAFHCTSNADCDDSAACTIDTCNASGMCNYMPVDALCPAGQNCQVGTGCTSAMFCNTAAMCDDAIACTIDSCDVGNVCGHMALDALCTTAGMNHCDAAMGCVPGSTTTCASAADCDDSVACTLDSCGADHACRHAVMDALCTGVDEHCDATLGCQVRHGCVTATDCVPFYNFCDGDPTCDPEFGCQSPPSARVCNDGNRCSTDSCDPAAGARGACAVVCDRAQTGCDSDPLCAVTGPSCTGNFAITPAPMNNCISDGMGGNQVHYDMSTATFDIIGGMLVVTPPDAHFGNLTDATAPVCPMFSARASVSGGTTETYTLAGMFTDDDHFTGTFTANLGGIGAIFGCTEGAMAVTGTRIP